MQVNPTLVVETLFLVKHGDDVRRTRFRLRDHPEVTAWLETFVDFIMFRQGKSPASRGIAEPPGGSTRDALVAGKVILISTRPDGGPALRLNPAVEICLAIRVRLHGEPARDTLVALAADPDLSRCLLAMERAGPHGPDPARLDPALVATLQHHGVLVQVPPPAESWLPDPRSTADLEAELGPAAELYLQAAGQPIPTEVRQVLGRHAPPLPPGVALAWGRDAGSGLVFPTLWSDATEEAELRRLQGTGAAARAASWNQQRELARASLRTRRYAVLRQIMPPAQQTKLRRYLREIRSRGHFPALGDGQVELRCSIHNQPAVASIHEGLATIVSSICGEPVIASYCFLASYEAGAILERHIDRPQCAYNLSLVFDMQDLATGVEPAPWPIYLEVDGKAQEVLLGVGDGLVYSGTELSHWRDALPANQRAMICFFHFVPPDFTGSLD